MTVRDPMPVGAPAVNSVRPLLVTVPQAAKILCIGRTAVYQLIWAGELTPIHIGRSVRFSLEQLECFVARRLDSGIERPPPQRPSVGSAR